jgi:MFS family permease
LRRAGVVLIAGAFVGSAVGEVVTSPAAGHLSDRVGRTAPIRIALVVAVPLLFVVGFAGAIPVAALAIAPIGAVVAVLWPLGTALLSDRAGRLGRSPAEVSAVSIVAWSVGLGGGSVLCGARAGAFGNGNGIAFLALPCLLGLALLGGGETGDGACLPRLDPQTVNSVN